MRILITVIAIVLCWTISFSQTNKSAKNNQPKISKEETEKWIIDKLTNYQVDYEVLPSINGNPRFISWGYKFKFVGQHLIANYVTQSGMDIMCSDSLSIDIMKIDTFRFMSNHIWTRGQYQSIFHHRHCLSYDKTKEEWIPLSNPINETTNSFFSGFKADNEENFEFRFNKAMANLRTYYKKKEAF